jgi:pyruvate/2-oxoglutarate dehydrogenase complex dihydrolipoamide dehydrogenase (E3) component
MFAIGRHPAVANLGLEKAGVAIDPKTGGIQVDAWSKTSVDNIYAIGDIIHRINLTPVAIREGCGFADTMFGKRPVQVDHATIPAAVCRSPMLGCETNNAISKVYSVEGPCVVLAPCAVTSQETVDEMCDTEDK